MRGLAEVAVIALLMAVPVEIKTQTIAGSSPTGKGLLSNCRVALQTGDKTKDGAVCIAFFTKCCETQLDTAWVEKPCARLPTAGWKQRREKLHKQHGQSMTKRCAFSSTR